MRDLGFPRGIARVPALPAAVLLLVAMAASALLVGCGDAGTGPVDVRWDRVGCDRCRMMLSDRRHAAQVRIREADKPSRVMLFDDIGCAVVWLEDKPWREDPATEIWVTDWRTGEWIDARTAVWVTGQVTPMEYGLGAQTEPGPGGLDYAGARAHIFDVERRFNVHGGNMDAAHAH